MKWLLLSTAVLLTSLILSCDTKKDIPLPLKWSDEFDYSGLPNSSKWSYDVGDACDKPMGCGWGNNELQYYTDRQLKNARVEDGHLIIEAHQARTVTRNYSSARLVSRDKATFKYGRMDIRAKLPTGRGTWPAIWMMPQDNTYGGWPRSGEIDIMEHVGHVPDSIFGTPHTLKYHWATGTQKEGGIRIPNCEDSFHTYSIDWNADRIDWLVDGDRYHRFNRENGSEAWPFDQPFYFILNIAVGGNWGGQQGVDTTIWPQKMLIDYVRVYGQ